MKSYPEDVAKAVERSRKIAEDSKRAVQPLAPNPDHIAQQWESVKRGQK